jgi:GTP-binding protein
MTDNLIQNHHIRNIAIISHVDHGKTTLIDAMFRQSGLFREGQSVEERLMDRLELERERGITIAAKNCAVMWEGVKINIVDTPGHADFGGEVERALSMVNGAILLVDASEGPLPQTRFVLEKTLAAGLNIIAIINKIDRKDARPMAVLDEVYDLFIDLDANDQQLEFPYLFAIGREGVAKHALNDQGNNLTPLFDLIVQKIPGPQYDPQAPFQMLVSDLGYSDFLGRLAIGRVFNGQASSNDQLICLNQAGQELPLRATRLQAYEGMNLQPVEKTQPGDIIVLSGIDDVRIGDTICQREKPRALKRISVDEPTVFMRFTINSSPLAGLEGTNVQSSKIKERLFKETLVNVAIQVEEVDNREALLVKGRGEFQLAILIETMRREGFELSVGRPEVIYKYQDGQCLEPLEKLLIDCEESFMGVITEKLAARKAQMVNLINHGSGRIRLEFTIPSRGLIGYRDEFLTDTKGSGLLNSYFIAFDTYRGDFPGRATGSIVSDRQGKAVAYALFNLEPRGELFIRPGDPVYEGMIFGEHNRSVDINANPCKEKKLTNVRASGSDENVILSPIRPMTLERALHFIKEDEMVEITPLSIRVRKTLLSAQKRHSLRQKKTG